MRGHLFIRFAVIIRKLHEKRNGDNHPKETDQSARESHPFGLAADPPTGKPESVENNRILLRPPSRAI